MSVSLSLLTRLPFQTLLLSLLFNSQFVSSSLTVTTANTIQGNKPYLTFDGGVTKAITTDYLLGITLSDGTVITALNDTSSLTTPITLSNSSDTFSSIKTLVPFPSENNTAYPSINLSDVIRSNDYWGDDDGDINPSATGSLTVKWENESGIDITNSVKSNPNIAMDGCDAPYKLTITSTDGLLSTQYGNPSSSSFTGSSHSYYIEPKQPITPYICFAKPNLDFNYGNQPEWNATKGFKVQNINIPESNFPTTGFNQAFFDITVIGALGDTVTQKPISGSPNVTLTLTANPNGTDSNIVRVTLNGPNRTNQAEFTPSVFELYSGTTKIYSFKLSKWFIAKSGFYQYNSMNDWTGTPLTPNYCANLIGNYSVPNLVEYTNANSRSWTGNVPDWTDNTFARQIGGGLFSEWGSTNNTSYKNSGFDGAYYWAIQTYTKYQQYAYSNNGKINYTFANGSDGKTACVSN